MISIVFSFYNEQEAIPALIQTIRAVMLKESEDYELIFVNDDSKDNSVQAILQQTKIPKEEIMVVNMSRRFGVEESFMAGMEVARGDAVILMYTDMQDPPETIHEMLSKWRQGADVVHTIRRRRMGEHPAKTIAVHFAYKWITKISDIKIPRDAGDFKLLSRRVVNHVRKFNETEPYLRGLIPWIGFKQESVLYDLQPRTVGKSKVALFGKKALKVFLSGIFSFSDFPVHFILFLAAAGFLGTCVAGILLLFDNQIFYPFAGFGVFLLFLWALTMLALGIIGTYVVNIYRNTTGRPRYIIKDIIRS
jgi:dolichol-phosphate mannosyltransferase